MASTAPPKTALFTIACLALVAAGCSGYLFYQSASGNIDACCGSVLETRWSDWFGVPVSALALPVYLAIATLAFLSVRRVGTTAYLVGAVLLATGAAVWFFVILIFIERASCPYCIATHLCGLGIAGITAGLWRKMPAPGAGVFAAAAIALVVMVAGQLVSGDSVEFEDGGASAEAPATSPSDGRTLTFAESIRIRLGQFPMVGPEQPTHYLAEIFDYTCRSCRDVYGDLKALDKAYPGVFTVIYLPAPLNPACNKYLPPGIEDHPSACEVARAALAVWAADPTKFAEFHDSMMKHPLPIAPADAESKAISLVGEEAFREALSSGATERALQTSIAHYSDLVAGNIRMPKLLIGGGKMLQGSAPSTEAFVRAMAKEFLLE